MKRSAIIWGLPMHHNVPFSEGWTFGLSPVWGYWKGTSRNFLYTSCGHVRTPVGSTPRNGTDGPKVNTFSFTRCCQTVFQSQSISRSHQHVVPLHFSPLSALPGFESWVNPVGVCGILLWLSFSCPRGWTGESPLVRCLSAGMFSLPLQVFRPSFLGVVYFFLTGL